MPITIPHALQKRKWGEGRREEKRVRKRKGTEK